MPLGWEAPAPTTLPLHKAPPSTVSTPTRWCWAWQELCREQRRRNRRRKDSSGFASSQSDHIYFCCTHGIKHPSPLFLPVAPPHDTATSREGALLLLALLHTQGIRSPPHGHWLRTAGSRHGAALQGHLFPPARLGSTRLNLGSTHSCLHRDTALCLQEQWELTELKAAVPLGSLRCPWSTHTHQGSPRHRAGDGHCLLRGWPAWGLCQQPPGTCWAPGAPRPEVRMAAVPKAAHWLWASLGVLPLFSPFIYFFSFPFLLFYPSSFFCFSFSSFPLFFPILFLFPLFIILFFLLSFFLPLLSL